MTNKNGNYDEYHEGRRVSYGDHMSRLNAQDGGYAFNAGAEQVPPFEEPYEAHDETVGCPTCGTARDITVHHPSDEFYCRDCGDRMTAK